MLLKPGVENLEYPFMFNGIDKLLHLSIFALLAFCFLAAYPKVKFLTFIQVMLIYSILTEILQDEMNMGRSFEGLDLVADVAGLLVGYFVFNKLRNYSN